MHEKEDERMHAKMIRESLVEVPDYAPTRHFILKKAKGRKVNPLNRSKKQR